MASGGLEAAALQIEAQAIAARPGGSGSGGSGGGWCAPGGVAGAGDGTGDGAGGNSPSGGPGEDARAWCALAELYRRLGDADVVQHVRTSRLVRCAGDHFVLMFQVGATLLSACCAGYACAGCAWP
eukprot:215532-Chlamydomonas_euryale.AAC.1